MILRGEHIKALASDSRLAQCLDQLPAREEWRRAAAAPAAACAPLSHGTSASHGTRAPFPPPCSPLPLPPLETGCPALQQSTCSCLPVARAKLTQARRKLFRVHAPLPSAPVGSGQHSTVSACASRSRYASTHDPGRTQHSPSPAPASRGAAVWPQNTCRCLRVAIRARLAHCMLLRMPLALHSRSALALPCLLRERRHSVAAPRRGRNFLMQARPDCGEHASSRALR